MQVDSAALQTGFDGLTTANQQLTDDAVDNKAYYDIQKASYNQLQVGACIETLVQCDTCMTPYPAGGLCCAADGV
jgi:hypothetical protein